MAKKKTRYIWVVVGSEPNLYVVKLHTYLNNHNEESYDEPPSLNKTSSPKWASNMELSLMKEWWATTEKTALKKAIKIHKTYLNEGEDKELDSIARASMLSLKARIKKKG